MNINIELYAQLFLVWFVLATIMIIYLARKKSRSPLIAIVLGVLSTPIPPLTLIYLWIMAEKPDRAELTEEG